MNKPCPNPRCDSWDCSNPIHKRVFLGGTCADSTWRDELILLLKTQYFNPVVEDWTEECVQIEEDEKWNKCDIHLYVISDESPATYSCAEAVESAMTDGKQCVFAVLSGKDFDNHQLKVFKQVGRMVEKHGGVFIDDVTLQDVADRLNK